MNDLSNTFKFDNSHTFNGFNRQENKKEDSENNASTEEFDNENSENSHEPLRINTKERKILTDWINAEYTSAFQYKKINLNYSSYTSSPIHNNNEVDINDPIIIYEFLKKYTNVLYDYDCDKETEKIIVDILEKELKEYYSINSTKGLEEYLNKKFQELKENYLSTIKNSTPIENINKLLFIKQF